MGLIRDDQVELMAISRQISDCHRQIEAQCERLARQTQTGHDASESRAVLLCLHRTLVALRRIRDATR
jgi:hypothetical protein